MQPERVGEGWGGWGGVGGTSSWGLTAAWGGMRKGPRHAAVRGIACRTLLCRSRLDGAGGARRSADGGGRACGDAPRECVVEASAEGVAVVVVVVALCGRHGPELEAPAGAPVVICDPAPAQRVAPPGGGGALGGAEASHGSVGKLENGRAGGGGAAAGWVGGSAQAGRVAGLRPLGLAPPAWMTPPPGTQARRRISRVAVPGASGILECAVPGHVAGRLHRVTSKGLEVAQAGGPEAAAGARGRLVDGTGRAGSGAEEEAVRVGVRPHVAVCRAGSAALLQAAGGAQGVGTTRLKRACRCSGQPHAHRHCNVGDHHRSRHKVATGCLAAWGRDCGVGGGRKVGEPKGAPAAGAEGGAGSGSADRPLPCSCCGRPSSQQGSLCAGQAVGGVGVACGLPARGAGRDQALPDVSAGAGGITVRAGNPAAAGARGGGWVGGGGARSLKLAAVQPLLQWLWRQLHHVISSALTC